MLWEKEAALPETAMAAVDREVGSSVGGDCTRDAILLPPPPQARRGRAVVRRGTLTLIVARAPFIRVRAHGRPPSVPAQRLQQPRSKLRCLATCRKTLVMGDCRRMNSSSGDPGGPPLRFGRGDDSESTLYVNLRQVYEM